MNVFWLWNILFAHPQAILNTFANNGIAVNQNTLKSVQNSNGTFWLGESASVTEDMLCESMFLKCETLYVYILLEKEVWVNFNCSGHIKENLSKECWWFYTVLLSWRDRARKWPHMTWIWAHVIASVPFSSAPTFIHASVLPQVHGGHDWRVVEMVRRHRCPLWPYQQHSAGVLQPSG